MQDLFRFLLLRPADIVKRKDVRGLSPSYIDKAVPAELAKRAALAFVEKQGQLKFADDLNFSDVAQAVRKALANGPIGLIDFEKIVVKVAAESTKDIAADDKFKGDVLRLTDTLVSFKLLSNSFGADAAGFAELLRGYDAIERAADGLDPVALRPLAMLDFTSGAKQVAPARGNVAAGAVDNGAALAGLKDNVNKLDAAMAILKTLPASGFHLAASAPDRPQAVAVSQRLDSKLLAAHEAGRKPDLQVGVSAPASRVERPWTLSAEAIAGLPLELHQTLAAAGVDLRTQPLPVVMNILSAQHTDQLMQIEKASMVNDTVLNKVGKYFVAADSNDYVGQPGGPMPTGHGSIRPVGVGDLLMVKEHVLRYEGGDLAHVENVLKSEHLSRDTRRLERTETTVFTETESTKEEMRDTQTTDRFSMKRETSDTIKTDAALKAGLSVDAKYGPFVEVKANADFSTSTSVESSTKTASEFSKDVVARSVSKLVERVLQRRSTTTIDEFEEKYSHGFDNTNGAGHISGYYQWIDKIMQAQVYNYGKRLLFDVTLPEPGTNFILAETATADRGQNLTKPLPFTLTSDQINAGNYALYAQRYGVTGLEPPPAPVKTVSKAYDATVAQDPHESTKSEVLPIDEGYRAKYALFERHYFGWQDDNIHWKLLIGNNWVDAFSSSTYYDLAGEIGSVAFGYEAYKIELLTATLEVFCEVTERAIVAWQIKAHDAISQGYQAKLEAYNQALAEALAAAGTVISGRNPIFNTQLIMTELRKQCLTLLTAQQFDGFGALELSAEGYAQPNLARTAQQMPYVRFFEQAFEWEHIVYFFYPYFWGWKPAWIHRILLDDVDPAFADFLRAGAGRVVFPVRPGFEAAIIHYLETGEIWNGGPPPDITSSLYVPIIKEIQEATGAPGSEIPVGDPWLVHLPTTLVRLRPNNDLPVWQKVNEDWQAAN